MGGGGQRERLFENFVRRERERGEKKREEREKINRRVACTAHPGKWRVILDDAMCTLRRPLVICQITCRARSPRCGGNDSLTGAFSASRHSAARDTNDAARGNGARGAGFEPIALARQTTAAVRGRAVLACAL